MIPVSATSAAPSGAQHLAGRRASACRYEIKCHAAAASNGKVSDVETTARASGDLKGDPANCVTESPRRYTKSLKVQHFSVRRGDERETKPEMRDARQWKDGKNSREVLKGKLSETN